MADNNDDEWLYGAEGERESAVEQQELQNNEVEITSTIKNANNIEKTFETFDEHNFEEAGEEEQLTSDDIKDTNEESNNPEDEDSDDDDDDDINVVIGDIKSGGTAAYTKGQDQKQKQPGSKFNIEEFESVGTINGQPAYEFTTEGVEDKPWRKPGADITDYFNYGFNEETWRAYCERQKRMRIHESGIGLASLTAAQNPGGNINQQQGPTNEGSGGGRPYINIGMNKGMGRGPRPPRPAGTIDVIGAPSQNPIRPMAPRENVIQVMTADRREYSRTVVNQNPQMPMQFNVPAEDFYNHEEQDAFNYGYEPTQDGNQWEGNSNWAPSEIKELTPMNQPPPGMHNAPNMNIPPPMMQMMPPQNMIPPLMGQMPIVKQEPEDKRDNRRMGRDNRDFRDDRRHDDRKRMRERSNSRERGDLRKSDRPDRPRDDRPRSDRDRYPRESSSRSSRRSKSRDRSKRSKSRDRKRSRSKDHKSSDDRGSRSDKSKRERSKKEDA
ncbi:hypothetical protein PVAND_002655 [Polypedilum vanderplanki]|uniref:Pre-mRNA polyadenylation factor Fip1 domain-containing protein n=1 Tax=Polypedilum vanderplanki TaxID=319348 RepID=A0A9J6BRN1_POLVA|nr:hypothetical protein PVAND_002655 [Polypedilum vanderplanki]